MSQLVTPVSATVSLAARGSKPSDTDAEMRAIESERNQAMATDAQRRVASTRGLLEAVAWLGLANGVADAELRAIALRTLAAAVSGEADAQNMVLRMTLPRLKRLRRHLHNQAAARQTQAMDRALAATEPGAGTSGDAATYGTGGVAGAGPVSPLRLAALANATLLQQGAGSNGTVGFSLQGGADGGNESCSVLAAVIATAGRCTHVEERQAAFDVIRCLFANNPAARIGFIGHAVTPPPMDLSVDGRHAGPPPPPPGRALVDKLLMVAEAAVRRHHGGGEGVGDGGGEDMALVRALWGSCRLFELVLGDDPVAKELALRIPTTCGSSDGAGGVGPRSATTSTPHVSSGPGSSGSNAGAAMSSPLRSGPDTSLMFPRWCALFAQAMQNPHTPAPVRVAMARATCVWLSACPATAKAFISSPANLYLFDMLAGRRRLGSTDAAPSSASPAPPLTSHGRGVAAAVLAACLDSLGDEADSDGAEAGAAAGRGAGHGDDGRGGGGGVGGEGNTEGEGGDGSSGGAPTTPSRSQGGSGGGSTQEGRRRAGVAVTGGMVLKMISSTVGLTRFTEILDALRATPEFRAASGKTAEDQKAAEQCVCAGVVVEVGVGCDVFCMAVGFECGCCVVHDTSTNSAMVFGFPWMMLLFWLHVCVRCAVALTRAHEYPLYDQPFTRLVDSLCAEVQRRIIALYTGASDLAGDSDGQPVDAATASRMREALRMQERELTGLREQVRVLKAMTGDVGAGDVDEQAAQAAQAAVVAQAEVSRWKERAMKAGGQAMQRACLCQPAARCVD